MRVRFIAQPFENGHDLRDFMLEVLGDELVDELLVVVAWAKRSGLRLFAEALEAFRERGGSSRLFVGISEGGATRQGLELALDLFDEVLVVHDVSGRTFHPKIYVALGENAASVLVGSHNLTKGGAFANYEAGVLVNLDLPSPEADEFLASVEEYVNQLEAEAEICVPLSYELLEELVADPRYQIGDEDKGRGRGDDSDSDSVGSGERPDGVFTKPTTGRRAGPRTATGKHPKTPVLPPTTPKSPTPIGPGPGGTTTPTKKPVAVKRWYKEMSRADAQRPASGTNPTGHLSLVQAGHELDWTTYFRDDFFGDATWIGGRKEEAYVDFRTFVRGTDLGTVRLRLSHTPAFEAGQGNRTTVLHWGQNVLRERMKAENLVGDFITLERLSDGSFVLTIDQDPVGEFIG